MSNVRSVYPEMTALVRRLNSVWKQSYFRIQGLVQVLDIRRSNRMNKSDASEMLQGGATLHQPVSFLAVYKYTVCSNVVQCTSFLFLLSHARAISYPASSVELFSELLQQTCLPCESTLLF